MKATTPDQLPPAKLFDETFVVKLMKGREIEASFTLHKGVAAFSSDYFEAAMKNTFKEGQQNCIEIPDAQKESFAQLVAWMYHRKFEDYGAADSITALTNLFILADRFMVPFLGNILINRMHEKSLACDVVFPSLVTAAYKNTPQGSGLRKFAIDLWVKSMDEALGEWSRDKGWDTDILCDIMGAMYEDRVDIGNEVYWKERHLKMDFCKYHAHKEGERCTRKV